MSFSIQWDGGCAFYFKICFLSYFFILCPSHIRTHARLFCHSLQLHVKDTVVGKSFFLFFFFKLVTWPTGERNYNCINFYYKIFEHIFLILVISQKKKKEKEEEEKRISIITSQMNSLCLVLYRIMLLIWLGNAGAYHN